MKRPHIIMLAAFIYLTNTAAAQQGIETVLTHIENNNARLEAARSLVTAQILDARTGNSLENPEIDLDHVWGKPSSLGKSGELTVVQGFDFPTVYANRNRLARSRAGIFGHQYNLTRAEILLQAKILCIDIVALQKERDLLEMVVEDAIHVEQLVESRSRSGDASAIDVNKSRLQRLVAENELTRNRTELDAAMRRLENLNGGIPLPLIPSGFGAEPLLPPEEQMWEFWQDNDPSLLILDSEREAAEKEIALSKSMGLPRLGVGYKHEFSTGEKFHGITVGMSIPMFGNRNNVKRAKAQAFYAEQEVASGILDARSTLAELYQRAETLGRALEQYSGILDASNPADMLRTAVTAGRISLLEYYNELDLIYSAQTLIVDTERQYRIVCARITMPEL